MAFDMEEQFSEECVDSGSHEECGGFGAYDFDGNDIASTVYYGLFALQHRGQESCGIAVSDTNGPKKNIQVHKGMGLVNEVFSSENLEKLKGNISVGHVRYSTAGSSTRENAQPLVLNYYKGTLALAHNGNLVNALELREELVEGTGLMGRHERHRGAVGAGVDLELLADASEAGVVVVAVLHVLVEHAQAVQLGAGVGREGGHVGVLPLGHHLGRGGGVVAGDHAHAGQTVQKAGALADGLRMGVDLRQLLRLCPGQAQQLVPDAQTGAAHDGQVLALEQVVHCADGAVGAVFDGQHAELAQAGLHRRGHGLKALDVHDVAPGQQPVARGLRVGALHALTGHKAGLGEHAAARREGRLHLRGHVGGGVHQLRLPRAGEVEQGGEQVIGVALLVARLRRDLGEDLTLPLAVADGQALLVLGGGHVLGQRHPGQEELEQLLVHCVDLFTNLRKFHGCSPFHFLPEAYPAAPRRSPPPPPERPGGRCRGRAAR